MQNIFQDNETQITEMALLSPSKISQVIDFS